jgi:hypothetical protein
LGPGNRKHRACQLESGKHKSEQSSDNRANPEHDEHDAKAPKSNHVYPFLQVPIDQTGDCGGDSSKQNGEGPHDYRGAECGQQFRYGARWIRRQLHRNRPKAPGNG